MSDVSTLLARSDHDFLVTQMVVNAFRLSLTAAFQREEQSSLLPVRLVLVQHGCPLVVRLRKVLPDLCVMPNY